MIVARTLYAVYPRAFDNPPGGPGTVVNGAYQQTPDDVTAARMNQLNNHAGMDADTMTKRSSDSAAMVDYWDLTDAIVDGIDALRLQGEKYLPKFVNEEKKTYDFRLKMTKMTNIYRDTVEGLASKPFEQEVSLTKDDEKSEPQQITDFIENVDGAGNNLSVFASQTFFNGINSAIDWIFVDFSKPDPTVRTLADAKERGVRPYWSHVLGRNVLEVRSTVIAGVETLTYIRIYEPGSPDRVRIFERNSAGAVVWSLHEKRSNTTDGKLQYVEIENGTITIGVIPLVPFITGRRDGRSWRFFPAMRDAADLQIELYQQESGLKYIKTLAAYPMLAGNGIKPIMNADNSIKKLAVGPGRVLYSPPSADGRHGEWKYVEPTAENMKFLADDIAATQAQARELGRQPLTAQSPNMTVINSARAAGKAKSAVSAWALGLKDALENAMYITALWYSISKDTYEPQVNVYTEFDEFLDGKDLDTLNSARKNGDLSQESYWEELKRRAVLKPEFNAEIERERILDETPDETGLEDQTLDANGNPIPIVKPPIKPKPGNAA